MQLFRAVPTDWVLSGQPVAIEAAPTRWGRVSARLQAEREQQRVLVSVRFEGGEPPSTRLRIRLPKGQCLLDIHTV